MTTLVSPALTRSARLPLAARELRRFAVNPLFLLGVALTAFSAWGAQRSVVTSVDTFDAYPAIFLGGFGMMAAEWLTRSTDRGAEVTAVAPLSLPARTAASCAIAVLPGLLGVAALVAVLRYQPLAGDWVWGDFDSAGHWSMLVSLFVLPALGGPLLGVALARWVRFPGISLVVFLFLYGWVTLTVFLAMGHPEALLTRMLRLLSPFTFFSLIPDADVVTLSGVPWCFPFWQLSLCAVAVTAAMLRGAEGAARRRIRTGLIVALVTAAAFYAMGASTA
jgi:hypothetical protein